MRYLSVCSGIEAATVAWHPLGWEAAAFSEIEAFPRAVLKHHYPQVPCHGDFTTIGADEYGAIDLLVGGTPCQSFSVAGLRGGLGDDRGNLALEYLRLADRTRPRWLVWENVPGVLSSNGGRDFGAILGGMVELGYSFAYRVLDAQHFGVPQRRRRVFVVGHLGDWRPPAAVLFERHGLSGHNPPRRNTGQGNAARVARSLAIRGRDGTPQAELGDDKANAILTPNGGRAGVGVGAVLIGGFDYENNAHGADEPTGPLLKGSPTGGGRPLPAIAVDWPAEVSPTLDTYYGDKMGLEDQHVFNQRGGKFVPVSFGWQNSASQGDGVLENAVSTLDKSKTPAVLHTSVRRLTPRECERLQGFPDDYTLVPYRGKLAADGPRYKALGNSMAVPVMRWIGERIEMVEALQVERIAA